MTVQRRVEEVTAEDKHQARPVVSHPAEVKSGFGRHFSHPVRNTSMCSCQLREWSARHRKPWVLHLALVVVIAWENQHLKRAKARKWSCLDSSVCGNCESAARITCPQGACRKEGTRRRNTENDPERGGNSCDAEGSSYSACTEGLSHSACSRMGLTIILDRHVKKCWRESCFYSHEWIHKEGGGGGHQ